MHVMTSRSKEWEHTMTQEKSTQGRANLKALIADDKDFLRQIVREALQQVLEAEILMLWVPSRESALKSVWDTAPATTLARW